MALPVLFDERCKEAPVGRSLQARLAGVGYGIAYQRTRRIEAAIAVHFGVNAIHFLLFTYPALAG